MEKNKSLRIKRWGINGEGIGYVNKKPIFLMNAIPDEIVEYRILREFDRYMVGKTTQIVKESPRRRYPLCPIWQECGGCSLMHVDYKGQVRMKEQTLKEALKKYADYQGEILPMIKNPEVLAYRNSCKLPFSMVDEKIATGMYARNSNTFIAVDRCFVHSKILERVRAQVVEIMNRYDAQSYNKKKTQGFRNLVLKEMDGKVQVVFVTDLIKMDERIVNDVIQIDEVVSVWQNMKRDNESEVQVFGKTMKHVAGDEKMDVQLNDLTLRLLPRSFFQLNTKQAEQLYDCVKEWLPASNLVVEAYSGIGAMSLLVSDKSEHVIGIESIQDAVTNAIENAELNHKENVEFICGDAEEELMNICNEKNVDSLIVDPPRTGLSEGMKETIKTSNIQTIIYVSCNPSTLAKDLNELGEKYAIKKIQPFDMFSQTPHVETVVLLERDETIQKTAKKVEEVEEAPVPEEAETAFERLPQEPSYEERPRRNFDRRPRRDGERSFDRKPRRDGERSFDRKPRRDGERSFDRKPRRDGERSFDRKPRRDGERSFDRKPRRDGERSFDRKPRRDGERSFDRKPRRDNKSEKN